MEKARTFLRVDSLLSFARARERERDENREASLYKELLFTGAKWKITKRSICFDNGGLRR